MKIRIIAIGKIKDAYLKMGISDYLTRLKPYADTSIVEVNDDPLPANPNDSDILLAINNEGKRVLKLLKPTDYVINLDLCDRQFDSVKFSSYLMDKLSLSGANLTFVIGGSYGLSDALKCRANDSLCLSKMTFLHTMTRLILLEQIYRAFKIYRNETYHK